MRYLLSCLSLLLFNHSFSQLVIDVRSMGAFGDNSHVNTTAIQRAIDTVYARGGGEVLITNGTYVSSTIILKSNVTLRIDSGTVLIAMPNDADYPNIPYDKRSWNDTYTQHSLIFAENANNIRITGGGTIDGNGLQLAYLSISKNLRPFGLRIHACNGVIIDSITLRQAPQWMGHLYSCNNVHINHVTIYNQCLGSNDGIDIDGCRNVLAENCNFDTNDDPMPIKTESLDTCRDVLVRNCTFATYERAVKVGNESFGPLINIRFDSITVNQSSFALPEIPLNAIYCAIADGGSADSIYISHIRINTPTQTAIFIKLCQRDFQYDTIPPPVAKYLRNVWISDIIAKDSTTIPCSVTGIPGHPVENIHLNNIHITVPGNGPIGSTNIPELISTRPECNIWADSLPAYGLYVRHVNGLTLDSFCINKLVPDVRPIFYFEDTTNIPQIIPCSSYTVGLQDRPTNEIKIFPNPANSILNINYLPAQTESIVIYNYTGTKIQDIPTSGNPELQISISKLPQGLYFIGITGTNYEQLSKLVVIK